MSAVVTTVWWQAMHAILTDARKRREGGEGNSSGETSVAGVPKAVLDANWLRIPSLYLPTSPLLRLTNANRMMLFWLDRARYGGDSKEGTGTWPPHNKQNS